MADRLSPFESKIDAALRRLDELDRRFSALESRFETLLLPPAGSVARADEAARPEPATGAIGHRALVVASLTGRTFLVLGGAYLLRALTDSGVFPRALGIGLGLAYAIAWIAMADRAGRAGKRASAMFHGIAAAAIAFPLLFEAIVRFKLLTPWAGAAALAIVAGLGMAVAWYRWLPGLAWVISLSGILAALALIRVTADVAPFGLLLVVLGIAAFWLAHARTWWPIAWPAALVADAIIGLQTIGYIGAEQPGAPATVILVQVVLFGAYLVSVAIRTLVLAQAVNRFEVVQSIAALLIGFGGAAYWSATAGLTLTPLGVTGLVVGAASYAIAFGFVAGRQGWQNFYFYSSLAFASTVAGGSLMYPASLATLLWIFLALATVWLGKQFLDVTLSAHGVGYLLAAGVASGLLVAAKDALLASAARPWHPITAMALLSLAAAVACSAIAPTGVRTVGTIKIVPTFDVRRNYIGLPRAVALGVLVIGLAGALVFWLVPMVARQPGSASDAGIVATVRTIVLAMAVILMGVLASGDRVREARWLIYPLLIVAGLKILLEDFRQSEPATLFVALAVYGIALIVGPRLAAR